MSLLDRTAFHVDLDGVAVSDIEPITFPDDLSNLRRAARKVSVPKEILEDLVVLAVSFGISSLRAPSFALFAAQTHAALHRRGTLISEDVTAAVALVYAHRATQLPQDQEPIPR